MSKSSKSARHSDDKNYQRKVMNAPQKVIFEENFKQLHDSRNFATTGTTKQLNVAVGKKFKSKLRSPTRTKILHPSSVTTQVNPQTTSSKVSDKRLSFIPFQNTKQFNTMKTHQDSGEPLMIQTKASRKEMKQNKTVKIDDNVDKDKESKSELVIEPIAITNTNGKSGDIELIQSEVQESPLVNVEKVSNECEVIDNCSNNENDTNNKIDEIDCEQNNLNGHKDDKPVEEKLNEIVEILETRDANLSIENEKINEELTENIKLNDEKELIVPLINNEEEIKLQNDDYPSGSNLVGSTTSESSPMKDIENQTNKQDNTQSKEIGDQSFVLYDSNIMLKDVQIKLNDCLKENSKLFDVTDPNASMSEAFKDMSFGRTLRSISGRSSLRRMKHVTVREHLLTPNDSLFVNTSGVSLAANQDQSRHSELNSATPYHNISCHDRKRKLNDDNNDTSKKFKSDESLGLLNTSLEYLRNLRKPIQVSTPNAHGYKFNIDDKKMKDDRTIVDQMVEPKKWCTVM